MTIGISKERLEELSSKASREEDKEFLDTLIFQCTELNPWIPIDDGLKTDVRYVKVFDIGYGQIIAAWSLTYECFVTVHGHKLRSVTHYQELPGDPK